MHAIMLTFEARDQHEWDLPDHKSDKFEKKKCIQICLRIHGIWDGNHLQRRMYHKFFLRANTGWLRNVYCDKQYFGILQRLLVKKQM